LKSTSSILRADVPRAFAPLLKPARYKGAYGGRGGAKSHFFAEQLIIRCYARQTRAACIREVQNSLRESVRQLLVDKIEKFGLESDFDILENEIRGPHGSLIIFKGMQSYNAETIKSLEGFDIAWVEEAQTLSAHSLKMLRPTIRNEGSEIWFSWNPRHDTDAVDAFFRGPTKPSDAIAIPVGWQDNPWFPDVLRREKDDDFRIDPEQAEHVWGGGYEIVTEGSYYAKLLAHAEKEGRIGSFPYNPKLRLRTAWDIGVDDYTAVWFMQDDGVTVDAVDYFEASGEGAEQVIRTALPELIPDDRERKAAMVEFDRAEAFKYNTHFLPHDVMVREWGAGAKTRYQTLMGLGVKPIHVGVAQGPAERINAVRRLLPIVRFNNTKRVQVGLSRLRRYSRRWNDSMQSYTAPLHDINSHGSDALGEYAVNCGIKPRPEVKPAPKKDNSYRFVADRDSGPSVNSL
jgi:phage terminase large subunit